MYKLDGFKEYRKQLGLNLIRNPNLAQESGKRSVNFTLQQSSEVKDQSKASPRQQHHESTLINDLLLQDSDANDEMIKLRMNKNNQGRDVS